MAAAGTQVSVEHVSASVLPEDNVSIPLKSLGPDGTNLAVQDESTVDDQEVQGASQEEYPHGVKLQLTIVSVAFMTLLAGLDANILATALPAITDHFHTVGDIGWYYSGYKLTVCALQFFFGKLVKMFPIKHVLCISIIVFILGSVLCAAAVSSAMLVFGRAVTGVGCAGAIACLFTLQVYLFPPHKRPLFMSGIGLVELVSTVSGPLLGGIITQYLSWRWCFWILVPLGSLSLVVTMFCMPEITRELENGLGWKATLKKLDLVGTALFVPSITCLFLAFGWAGYKYTWSDPVIIGLLVTFAVLLAAFIYDQHLLGDDAAIPLRIAKDRDVIAGSLFIFCAVSSANVVEYYMPTYFQAVHGFSPSRSGYQLLPIIIGSTVAFIIGGVGISTIGYYKPFMIVGAVILPIATGLVTTWKVETPLVALIIYPGLVGFGGSIGNTAPYSAFQLQLSKADTPLASAVLGFAQSFGPALTVSIAQNIFSSRLKLNFARLVPGVDPSTIENLGLTDIKTRLGATRLDDALKGFDESLIQTWYLALGLSCVTIVGATMLRWGSVKKKKS